MQKSKCAALLALAVTFAFADQSAAQQLKIASPQRGSWEGSIPELGKQQGIFKKHGLDLEILYTAGGGETLQAVISGSVDVGLSAGTLGVLGAFLKNAPVRIIGASSTGSRELFWYVPEKSPLQSIRAVTDQTLAYSTNGSSTHTTVLRFMSEYGLKGARPTATGDVTSTITQVMSGQVDVGWSVAPFNLDQLERGQIRVIGRASDIERIRGQTIRVQITNAQTLAQKKDAIARYMKAYEETLNWMHSSPEALARYVALSKISEASVRRMLKDFIPRESLQTQKIMGLNDSMQDAIQFKFAPTALTEEQFKELIQIPPV